MNWKKTLRAAGLVAALTFSLVGCNSETPYSPQEIIDQALQETKEPLTYYGEYTMDMGEVGGMAHVKEWSKDGKRRIDMTTENGEHFISVNNGSQIILYDVVEKTAQTMNYKEGDLDGLQSPKDQAEILFNMVKNTHDVKIDGEEKIAGRNTYKVVAKAKNADTLMGDMEVWIDKKTWLTLKTVTNSAGSKMVTEYTKIDIDKKIDEAQFTLDIPDDVKIEEITAQEPEAVTLDVVKEQLGEFLMVPEGNGVALTTIQDMKVEERPEFSLEYQKDEQPAFSVSVFKMTGSYTEFGGVQDEKPIEVRGKQGTYMELGEFLTISWQEKGYQYNIIRENPELSKEDLVAYANQMTINK